MKSLNLKGTGVALATPFDEEGAVDFQALDLLLNHVTAGEVDYLVVLGTTAESATLSPDEKISILEAVVTFNQGRLPIVLGAGGNDTAELISYLGEDFIKKADAILSVTPYYNRPNQRGLLQHYQKVADHSPIPVVLYNVPSRTAVNLDVATTVSLAKHPNIIAIKEATDDPVQIRSLLENPITDFSVISGDDLRTVDMMKMGAVGAISVLANAYPKIYAQMVNAALSSDYENAYLIHRMLSGISLAIMKDGNPSGLKCLLHEMKLMGNKLRLPLVPVEKQLQTEISQLRKIIEGL